MDYQRCTNEGCSLPSANALGEQGLWCLRHMREVASALSQPDPFPWLPGECAKAGHQVHAETCLCGKRVAADA